MLVAYIIIVIIIIIIIIIIDNNHFICMMKIFTKIKISRKGKNYKFRSNIDISLFKTVLKLPKRKKKEKKI